MSKFTTTKAEAIKAAKIINKAFGTDLKVFRNETEFYQLADFRTVVTELPIWELNEIFQAAGLNIWHEFQNDFVMNIYPGDK